MPKPSSPPLSLTSDKFLTPRRGKPYRARARRQMPEFIASGAAGVAAADSNSPVKKTCGDNHFCLLKSIDQCCACADRRPVAERYSEYVDGFGEMLTAFRWKDYCYTCRAVQANGGQSGSGRGKGASGTKREDAAFADTPHPLTTLSAAAAAAPQLDGVFSSSSSIPFPASSPTARVFALAPTVSEFEPTFSNDHDSDSSDGSDTEDAGGADDPDFDSEEATVRAFISLVCDDSEMADWDPAPPARRELPSTSSAPWAKTCGEDHLCMLESTRWCCACEDRRPLAERYPEYIDGVGEVSTASRWKDYCPVCRAAHRSTDTNMDDDDDWAPFSEAGTSEWEWNALTDVDELDSSSGSDAGGADDADNASGRSRVSESGMSDWNSISPWDDQDDWSDVSDTG